MTSHSKDVLNFYYTKRLWNKPNVKIGEYTYGNPKIRFLKDDNHISIGRFTSIGHNVNIYLGGNHRYDWVTAYPFPSLHSDWPEAKGKGPTPTSNGPVIIGNDVWIGNDVTILSGITIGDGAVIGTGSMVTKDIEPYSIVGGNPANHIKYRFSTSQIKSLLSIQWWNWDETTIRANMHLLCQENIDAFINANEPSTQAKSQREQSELALV